MDKESFMDGNLGLGMAIPEDATAALGPLPHLVPTISREQKDAEVPTNSLTLSIGTSLVSSSQLKYLHAQLQTSV
jgi:hypothetical protein